MPRKVNQGTRSPSTRLNDTVNQLSDGEFDDLVTILRGGKKKRKYLDLIVWHRGRQPYDPKEEKDAFEDYDLNSLRDVARRRVGEVVTELRSGLPPELAALLGNLGLASKAKLLEALDAIATAKAHAIKRCYLHRLVKLIELETSILPIVHSGEELHQGLERTKQELVQAQANLVLQKEITYYRTEYLDKVNAIRTKTGALDQQTISEYLASDFAKRDVRSFPPLLLSEKTLLDEVFNGLNDNVGEACRLADIVCELDRNSPFLSPLSRAKLLVRLNDYCIALGDRLNGEQLIAQFAALDPEKPENRDIYLIRFLVTLLDWATEGHEYVSFDTVLAIFERNESFVLASPIGGNRSRILIAMMMIYLGRHEGDKAKRLFDHLYRNKEQKPPLYYRLCFLICHLMILYDLKAVADLKLNAKNYREFMLEKGEIAIPAIDLLGFLRKNVKRFASPKLKEKEAKVYNVEVDSMIKMLKTYQSQDLVAYRIFYGPCISWLNAKHV